MSFKEDLPNDIEELKDIIFLQRQELIAQRNKLKLWTDPNHYNVTFNFDQKKYPLINSLKIPRKKG